MYRIESEISANFSPGSRGTDLLIGLPINPFCGPAAPCSGPSTLGLEAGSAFGLPRLKSRTEVRAEVPVLVLLVLYYTVVPPSGGISNLFPHIPANSGETRSGKGGRDQGGSVLDIF